MAYQPETCPKCAGRMEQGFILDMGHGGSRSVSRWGPGAPEKSFWMGTAKPERLIPIGTFRCKRCGYLEHYAREEFEAR